MPTRGARRRPRRPRRSVRRRRRAPRARGPSPWAAKVPLPSRKGGRHMRIESSVTSISWIPSEAVTGMTKLPFEVGVTHYDNPPPDVIDDLEGLGAADGFRFANRLRAWIEIDNGKIVDHGYA